MLSAIAAGEVPGGSSQPQRNLLAYSDSEFLIEDAPVLPENQARVRFVADAQGAVTGAAAPGLGRTGLSAREEEGGSITGRSTYDALPGWRHTVRVGAGVSCGVRAFSRSAPATVMRIRWPAANRADAAEEGRPATEEDHVAGDAASDLANLETLGIGGR